MKKNKSAIVMVAMALLSSSDMILGYTDEIITEAGLPGYYSKIVKAVAAILTVCFVAMQPPPNIPKIKRTRSPRPTKIT